MPFGYVVVQYINQKSYYWDFLVHLLIWPQEGPKDEYFGPKWQTRLYNLKLIGRPESTANYEFKLKGESAKKATIII